MKKRIPKSHSFTFKLNRIERHMLDVLKSSKYLKETDLTLTKMFTNYLQFQYMNAITREKQRVSNPE